MSSWIVAKEHIDLLVTAGLTFPNARIIGNRLRWFVPAPGGGPEIEGTLTEDNADEIGAKLWAENYAGVTHRYPSEADGGDSLPRYRYRPVPGPLDPVVVLKELHYYRYQSMDHPGWKHSMGHAFYEALMHACIVILPGYDEAPWGFDDRQFFVKQPQVR